MSMANVNTSGSMSKIAVLEVVEDVIEGYRPNYDEKYLAYLKGDLVYMPFDAVSFLADGAEVTESFLKEIFNLDKNRLFSARAYDFITLLESFAYRGKSLRKRCTLYEVLKMTGKCAFSTPPSNTIRYVKCIDGDQLFSEFVLTEKLAYIAPRGMKISDVKEECE